MIQATNVVERINKEFKWRIMFVGAFSSKDSLIGFARSILIGVNMEWVTGRKYRIMDER